MKRIAQTPLLLILLWSSLNAYCVDKFIYSNSVWSTAVWYDAQTGGTITTAPTAEDNVFTNGFTITVDGNFECNHITVSTSITGAITVNTPNQFTIHGTLTGPGWVGNDLIGGDGTIIFKASSGTILSNWASATTFENIIFDPGVGNTVNFSLTGAVWCWVSETGKITIASGTLILNGAGHNVAIGSKVKETGTIEIAEGATLEIQNNATLGSPIGGDSDALRMGKLDVLGTLKYSSNNNLNVKDFFIGENGYFENTKSKFYSIAPDYYTCLGTTNNFAKSKYIQANSNWSTAVWYNAPTGGTVVAAPSILDTAVTNGFVLTIDGDYHCGDIKITSNTTGAITVPDSNTLYIHGTLTGAGWVGNDLIGGNGTIVFRKTSGIILNSWASASIFENIVFDPGVGNTVSFATTGAVWCWVSATGKATVASGTLILNGAGHNVAIGSKPKETGTIEIAEGATLNIQNNATLGSPEGGDSDAYRMGKLNIFGTLLISTNNKINTTHLYVGSNGTLNTSKANFFSIAPDLFISDGVTIGVNEYYIDRLIQNTVFTTEENIKGNKIKVGSNVTDTKPSGQVVVEDGADVELDGASYIILDKGFQTKTGGSLSVK